MSNKLDEAREIINRVDSQMAELFAERLRAAEMVFEYKKEFGLPIYDPIREELKPQLEEDITSAVWVRREDLPKCLENTYPSIKEVVGRL